MIGYCFNWITENCLSLKQKWLKESHCIMDDLQLLYLRLKKKVALARTAHIFVCQSCNANKTFWIVTYIDSYSLVIGWRTSQESPWKQYSVLKTIISFSSFFFLNTYIHFVQCNVIYWAVFFFIKSHSSIQLYRTILCALKQQKYWPIECKYDLLFTYKDLIRCHDFVSAGRTSEPANTVFLVHKLRRHTTYTQLAM